MKARVNIDKSTTNFAIFNVFPLLLQLSRIDITTLNNISATRMINEVKNNEKQRIISQV